jgi:hypothetical protein
MGRCMRSGTIALRSRRTGRNKQGSHTESQQRGVSAVQEGVAIIVFIIARLNSFSNIDTYFLASNLRPAFRRAAFAHSSERGPAWSRGLKNSEITIRVV